MIAYYSYSITVSVGAVHYLQRTDNICQSIVHIMMLFCILNATFPSPFVNKEPGPPNYESLFRVFKSPQLRTVKILMWRSLEGSTFVHSLPFHLIAAFMCQLLQQRWNRLVLELPRPATIKACDFVLFFIAFAEGVALYLQIFNKGLTSMLDCCTHASPPLVFLHAPYSLVVASFSPKRNQHA
eukprot:879669-Pelagomonas_calceolata.AAC.1